MEPILKLMQAHGLTAINQLPGAAEVRIDEQYHLAVNGHDVDIQVQPPEAMVTILPPYHFAVWYNGWVAGIFDPFGGSFAAGGAANEELFCAAIEKHIAELGAPGVVTSIQS